MLKLFTGSFEHTIDTKNRVSVPRKILEVLRRLDSGTEVVITAGLDGCLFLYPPDEFERMSAAVEAGSVGEEAIRDFSRTFFSNAESCSVDKHGRMLLPDALKQAVGLTEKVVFAGVGRRVELWSPDAWSKRRAKSRDDYENQAKEVFR